MRQAISRRPAEEEYPRPVARTDDLRRSVAAVDLGAGEPVPLVPVLEDRLHFPARGAAGQHLHLAAVAEDRHRLHGGVGVKLPGGGAVRIVGTEGRLLLPNPWLPGYPELARILIGEDSLISGEVDIRGKKAHVKSVSDSLYKYNMGYITENRKEEGLLLESTVKTNIAITIWNKIKHSLFRAISPTKETEMADKMVRVLDIRTTGVNQITENLSGGNQQKVSISKWLAAGCDILIIDEPTVGVDVGAKEYIHRLIWDLANNERKSIILISSDMSEIIKLASRILVFKDKKIIGEITDINTETKDYEKISKEIGHYLA